MKAADAIKILDQLIENPSKRINRLLMEPDEDLENDWFISIPNAFIEALNIKYDNGWTQGSMFSFSTNDVLYDSHDAYKLSWGEGLKKINLCININAAKKAHMIPNLGRNPGYVTFTYQRPDSSKTKLVDAGKIDVTQDEFMRLVICGPSNDLCPELMSKDEQIELL